MKKEKKKKRKEKAEAHSWVLAQSHGQGVMTEGGKMREDFKEWYRVWRFNMTKWGTRSRQQKMKRKSRATESRSGREEEEKKEDGESGFKRLREWQQWVKEDVMSEWVRMRTIGRGDALIQWFQPSSLLPCLKLPVVVKSWKYNAATTNKSSSLTGIHRATRGVDVEAKLFPTPSYSALH